MPTTLTKLEVINLAMDSIREAPAASLATSSAPMRFFLRHYQHVVDMTLRSYVWNFAKELHELPEDVTTPAWGFLHRYSLPNGCLRVLKPTSDGYDTSPPIPYEIVGSFLHTDWSSPRRIKCIMRVENPGAWDPLFTELVVVTLGVRAANKFTGKAQYLAQLMQLLGRAQAKAEEIDSFEGSAEPSEQNRIITVRS
jgi:hypothetical protein